MASRTDTKAASSTIVDPKREIVTAFRLQDGRYERKEYTIAHAASLTTPLLPDLVIPLKAVFELP
jgi:hypothetical protein